MPRTTLLLFTCMLGAFTASIPAGARTHRMTVTTHPHSHTHINTEMGHIGGYTLIIDENSSEYHNIDAKCAAQGLGNVSSQSATVGVSQGSRRNFYAHCMVQNGAWR